MYNLTELKADPKIPHHYIIGVAVYPMTASLNKRGKVFLKYGPIYFHHKDIKNIQNATLMSVDKVFKTTLKEASMMYNCRSIIVEMYGLRLAAATNQATLHHFSSTHLIEDDWFQTYVDLSNNVVSVRKELDNARIKSN